MMSKKIRCVPKISLALILECNEDDKLSPDNNGDIFSTSKLHTQKHKHIFISSVFMKNSEYKMLNMSVTLIFL